MALVEPAEPQTALARLQKWNLMNTVPDWLLPKLSYALIDYWESYGYCGFLITDTDQVFVIGDNTDGLLALDSSRKTVDCPLLNEDLSGRGIIDIICMTNSCTVVARTSDGKIFTWGENCNGELGLGHTNVTFGCSQVKGVLAEERVIQHCCSGFDTLCLTSSGKLVGWGSNVFKEISGAAPAHHSPFVMTWLPPAPIAWIGASWGCFYALTESGEVYSWGKYYHGRTVVSDDKYTPKKVELPAEVLVKKVCCGFEHVLLLTTDNQLYSWGLNDCGQVGNGSEDGTEVKIPQLIELEELVEDILTVTSEYVSFCKTSDGAILNWGEIAGNDVFVPTATNYKSFDDALIANKFGMSSMWTNSPTPAEVETAYNAAIESSMEKKLVFKAGGKNIEAWEFTVKRSPVMRRMLETDWKVLAKDGKPIELKDIPNRSLFLSLMMFMHTDEVMAADEDLLELVRLANRYEVFEIGRKTAKRLEVLITESNALDIYQVARKCGATGVFVVALKTISRFSCWDLGARSRKRMKYDHDPKLIEQIFSDLQGLEFGPK